MLDIIMHTWYTYILLRVLFCKRKCIICQNTKSAPMADIASKFLLDISLMAKEK